MFRRLTKEIKIFPININMTKHYTKVINHLSNKFSAINNRKTKKYFINYPLIGQMDYLSMKVQLNLITQRTLFTENSLGEQSMVEENTKTVEEIFENIGLIPSTVKGIVKNEKLKAKLLELLSIGGITQCDKNIGNAIYLMAARVKGDVVIDEPFLVRYIADGKILTQLQIEEAISFLKKSALAPETFNIQVFERAAGVGINITPEDIRTAYETLITPRKGEILAQRYSFNFGIFLKKVREIGDIKWGNGRIITEELDKYKLELLGPKTKEDEKLISDKKKKGKEDKKIPIDFKTLKRERLSHMIGRDKAESLNTEKHLDLQREKSGGRVVTRFPPEPNGYLHIGHAKSMRFNFTLAEDYGGVCIVRFDDTNPEKESNEYIDSIIQGVKYLGYSPFKITHSSDYFDQLYEYAIQLIKNGNAYVCDLSKEAFSALRDKCEDSPNRDREVEKNLRLFEEMKEGKYEEGSICLRMKIDMKSKNPCLKDPVAYRIKHKPHPLSGDKWCIYPTYDMTHCICDSLEWITHSCCTLEFEGRRDSYYWLLNSIDIYRPYQWEFSRLNITNTVLSKRRIQSLVEKGVINGWDDPRIFTLMALKRRGVPPQAINEFVDLVGITRRGNEMFISYKLLDFCIRKELDDTAPRTMAILDPILVEIQNMGDKENLELEVPLFPKRKGEGSHIYIFGKYIYIDRSDFREEGDDPNYYGLRPGQLVLLKYAFWIELKEIIRGENGEIIKLLVDKVDKVNHQVKGTITWVNLEYSLDAEIRLFNLLFLSENPKNDKNLTDGINPNSLEIKRGKVWKEMEEVKQLDGFQFERFGYFCVDSDTKLGPQESKLVFNRTVTLHESKEKLELAKGKGKGSKGKEGVLGDK